MSERKLYQRFKDKIKKECPDCWVYKIPDTFNLGGKKPADFFLVVKGKPFLLEFKSDKGTLEKYQIYQLTEFTLAGGESLVYWEDQETLDEFVIKIMRKVL